MQARTQGVVVGEGVWSLGANAPPVSGKLLQNHGGGGGEGFVVFFLPQTHFTLQILAPQIGIFLAFAPPFKNG